jgi:serine O-acetyltransferase
MIGTDKMCHPVIGDDVIIYAGAAVLGNILIGNNVKIGANSVVTIDIPDDCVAVGIPARILESREKKKKCDSYDLI